MPPVPSDSSSGWASTTIRCRRSAGTAATAAPATLHGLLPVWSIGADGLAGPAAIAIPAAPSGEPAQGGVERLLEEPRRERLLAHESAIEQRPEQEIHRNQRRNAAAELAQALRLPNDVRRRRA